MINNPKLEECDIVEITITDVYQTLNNIVFVDLNADSYYINRVGNKNLSLEYFKQNYLNKKVTLHLPKYWIGTSEYIAQLAVNDEVIFTEFE